jgi:hypothetical protein
MARSTAIHFLTASFLCAFISANSIAQTAGGGRPGDTPGAPDPIVTLGDNLFRMGSIRIDTGKHEVTVPGKVTDASSLEFIASTNSTFRTYESAIQLDTNGLTFNVAMILIGLDKDKGVPSRFHFDPNEPVGDPVDIWVEWKAGAENKRIRAEDLLWDQEKNEVFPRRPWVYIGSQILPDGRYRADLDGVIIGFVHDPASIIEWTGSNGLKRFGMIKIDPKLKLQPGTPVTITIKQGGPSAKN